ncbi:tetratricopeptide repeat protein [Microbulbifer sp. MCCC 1A16149]|uniref:tetratricopeptide repeat protein n=1 Tax=Microbulbifer sp. MCCC 1A16149 TaxID=3411322 RepID=UPI003D0C6DD3
MIASNLNALIQLGDKSGWVELLSTGEFSAEFILRDENLVFVTFDNWEAKPPAKARFAEKFVSAAGYSHLHFSCVGNDWWQYKEFLPICKEIGEIIASRFSWRVGYGSSMGAYGALLFSSALKLNKVIALSPQFSIDRKKVEFEARWAKEAERINFIFDDMCRALSHSANILLAYDPNDDDSKHISKFPAQSNVTKMKLSGAGHPVGIALQQAGMLGQLVSQFLDNSISVDEFESDFSSLINETPQHYYVLARELFDKGEVMSALDAIECAIEKSGSSFSYYRLKGKCLFLLGDFSAALEEFNKAAEVRCNEDIAALALRSAVELGDFDRLMLAISRYNALDRNESLSKLLISSLLKKSKLYPTVV